MTRPRHHGPNRTLVAVACEAIDGGARTRVTFECKAGHRQYKTYLEDPRARKRRTQAVAPRWWLERACKPGGYWAKGSGHVYGDCKACDKNKEATQ